MNARSFGAAGDDRTGDDVALNRAVQSACSRNVAQKTVHIPGGFYRLNQPIIVSCGLTISGDGDATVLRPVGTIDAITFSTPARVQIQNLAISYVVNPSPNRSAIACNVPKGSSGTGLTIRDVSISNADTAISIHNCPFFILSANRLFSFRSVGIAISNPTNVDVGDGVVENNSLFNFGQANAAVGVKWISGGGVRITNNKFGALDGGVSVRLAPNARTSQIFIQNNSFDTMQSYGIDISRDGRESYLTDILFNGNVCTSCLKAVSIPHDPDGPWVSNIVAVGNSFIGLKKDGVAAFAIDSAKNIIIGNNALFSNHPASVAVTLGKDVDGAVIGPFAKAGSWTSNQIEGSSISLIKPD